MSRAAEQSEKIQKELGSSGYHAALKQKLTLIKPITDDLLGRISQGKFKILDVGIGPGLIIEQLLEGTEKGCSFVGVDIDERWTDFVEKLKLRWPDRLSFMLNSNENLPFRDGSFDMVMSVNSLHHFKYPEAMIREMLRVVKPGAVCAIYDFNPDDLKSKATCFLLTLKNRFAKDPASRAFLDSIKASYGITSLVKMFSKIGIRDYSISQKGIFNRMLLNK